MIPVFLLLCGAALAQTPTTGQYLLKLDPTRAGFTLQNMTPEEARLATQHVQYLKSLLDSGKMTLAAQVFDPKGLWGIVIVNAPDLQTARALLEGDPGVKGNMFRGEVSPLRVVFEKVEVEKPNAVVSAELEGDWEGAIVTPNGDLRVVVHFKNQADKTVKATLDSLDQGATGMALSDVVQKGSSVEFQFRMAKGAYKGEMNKEGTQITGQWSQNGGSVPLNLKKAAAK